MKYIATGRVHPERANISFGPIAWEIPGQGNVVASCELITSDHRAQHCHA